MNCVTCNKELTPLEAQAPNFPCLACLDAQSTYLKEAHQALSKKPKKDEAQEEEKRGGARSGAGRKATWKNGAADKVIRVPGAIADRVLDLAHAIDEDQVVLDTCDSNKAIIQEVLALLQAEADLVGKDRNAKFRRTPVLKALRLLEQYQ